MHSRGKCGGLAGILTTQCPTFKAVLLGPLQQAITLETKEKSYSSDCIEPQELMFCKSPPGGKPCYKSAIALRLSQRWQLSPGEVATALMARIMPLEDSSWAVSSLGWLVFSLGNEDIAQGLQTWAEFNFLCHPNFVTQLQEWQTLLGPSWEFSKHTRFRAQYAFARCRGILRLARQEKLLTENTEVSWMTQQGNLRFMTVAEWDLMNQLILAMDALWYPPQKRPLKVAIRAVEQLVEAFLNFERYCRIWGAVWHNDPQLAIARLGLVSVTQNLLYLWLEKNLHIHTDSEL